jgi:PIN domain nuclease of toxin-antitoxin system
VARALRRKAVAEVAPRFGARRILLDTHVWLWWQSRDARLGPAARVLIKNADEVRLSAASVWEIAIKVSIGKLRIPDDADFARELERDGFRELAISIGHTDAVRRLPPIHRDPFDRVLVAQAQIEGLTIVTADDALGRYGVSIVDAHL